MLRFKISALLIITALVAVGISAWRIHTVPFLPTIAHYLLDVLRGHEMRVSTDVGEYTVTLVQKTGSDFYETFFEISSDAHPSIAKLMIHPDDWKWRDPVILKREGRVYFCDGPTIHRATPYIDLAKMTVHYQLVKNRDKIVQLNTLAFTGGWGG